MEAVGFSTYLPADHQDALVAFDTPKPTPGPRDLLVAVKAVSINPVDTKVRRNGVPESRHRILGYDASGVVEAAGVAFALEAPLRRAVCLGPCPDCALLPLRLGNCALARKHLLVAAHYHNERR